MSFWKRRGATTEIVQPRPAALSIEEGQAKAGEYQLLYKYLRDRYANRVVLTFAEIEDLLGFALPNRARLHGEWWAVTDSIAPHSSQSDSWTLASRTATVNLLAQRVVFDRVTEAHA